MKTKKLLAMLIVLAMCMGLISVPAMAEGDNVAKIGSTEYATLEAAVGAANAGDTVTLLSDVTYDENHEVAVWEKGFNLDLGGKTFTTNSGVSKDLSNMGYKATAICYGTEDNNNITISNGTINTAYGAGVYIAGNVTATLSGLTVNAGKTGTQPTAEYSSAVRLTSESNVIIESGTYTGSGYAIAVSNSGGTVTVNGGTFTGGIFFNTNTNTGVTKSITINGGNFTGGFVNTDKGTLTITGGTFDADPTAYVPSEGYEVVNNNNGTWTVTTKKVAQIGDQTYATLAAAVAAVPDGTATTITMIADHQIVGNAGVTIPTNKNVVLDLNGHTLSNYVNEDKSSQVITNNGTLTIKDSATGGTITNAYKEGTNVGEWWSTPQYNYATNVITNCGTLTVESGNITQTAAGSICYAIDNNSTNRDTTLTINGGVISDLKGTVIRAFCNSTTKENNININGGTVKTPGYAALWIQLPGSSGQAKRCNLNITDGTLTGGTYAFYDYSYGDVFDVVVYNITGGNFGGYVGAGYIKDVGFTDKDGIIKFIKGGKYTQKPDDAYIATGYVAKAIDDDVYSYEVVRATAEDLKNLVIDKESTQTPADIAKAKVAEDFEAATSANATVVTAQGQAASKEFNIVDVTKENDTTNAVATKITVNGTEDISVENIKLETLGQLFAEEVTALKTNPTAELSLSITEKAAETTATSVTYDVHPEVKIGTETYPLEGPVVDGEYKFKLPVANSFVTDTRKTVKVTYEDEAPVYLPVQGESGAYYVEVTVTHFSDATVEPAEDVVISDVDAYIHSENHLGNIRFLTRVNTTDTVTAYGTYFARDNTVQTAPRVELGNNGTTATFDADVMGVSSTYFDTPICAISYVIIGGNYVWSNIKEATINQYNHNK